MRLLRGFGGSCGGSPGWRLFRLSRSCMARCPSPNQDALHFPDGPRNRGHKNLLRSRPQQYPGAFAGGGAGRHDVIHQQNILSVEFLRPGYSEGPAQVGPALMSRQPSLRYRFACPDERGGIQLDAGSRSGAQKRARDLFRLVESAGLAFTRPKRHGDNHKWLRNLGLCQRLAQEPAQQRRSRPYPLVFEDMDQVAQRAVIGAISNRTAERRRGAATEAAQRISLGFKMLAKEFLPAGRAQDVIQGNDALQAWIANGKIGNTCQRRLANTAVGRKQDREQALGRGQKRPFHAITRKRALGALLSPVWVSTTEDGPPLITSCGKYVD